MVSNTAISRRRLLKTFLTLGAGGVFLSLPEFLTTDGVIHATIGDKPSSSDIFTEVSRFVTLRERLAPDAVRNMYDIFKDEPWSKEHAAGIHRKITAFLSQDFAKNRPPVTDESWKFTDGEKWFAEHLLTTWYVGIYYHQERPTQRILYEDALMYEALDGILPMPFLENVGFGAWAEPPEGMK